MSAHVHQARVFRLPSGSWSWSYTLPDSTVESPVSFSSPYLALADLRPVLPRPYSLQCEHDPDYIFLGAVTAHVLSVAAKRAARETLL